MTGIRWTEWLSGSLSFSAMDFNEALLEDHLDPVSVEVDLVVENVERCIAAPVHAATVVSGHLDCEGLGGRLEIEHGRFELFVPASEELPDRLHMRMRYTLTLHDPFGEPLLLHGFKLIENDPGYDSWSDTTTLFTRLYVGGAAPTGEVSGDRMIAIGVLRISPLAFLRQLTTFRGTARSRRARLASILRYQRFFTQQLTRAYVGRPLAGTNPSFPQDQRHLPARKASSVVDWHPAPGSGRLERAIVPFAADDLPFELNLHRLRLRDHDSAHGERGPVLLVPGSGLRPEMFYGQPTGTSLAQHLLETGYDVWIESWRASIDLPRNLYTLDQAALVDHPAAIAKILSLTGREGTRIKAVVHCQGSVSFLMGALAGALGDTVSHVVSSAVSLFIDVTDETWLKQRLALPGVSRLLPWVDAQWGVRADTPMAALFAAIAKRAERPCGNPVCQVANFMYGAGWDVLMRHVDERGRPWVDDAVHRWAARELGYTPLSLIHQIAESTRWGHIVPAALDDGGVAKSSADPAHYLSGTPGTTARFTFLGGDHNRMFRWQGQEHSATFLRSRGLDADFALLRGYGHLDTFWGRNAAAEVFPLIVDGLEWSGDNALRPGRSTADPASPSATAAA